MSKVEDSFFYNICVPDFILFTTGISAVFALLLAVF